MKRRSRPASRPSKRSSSPCPAAIPDSGQSRTNQALRPVELEGWLLVPEGAAVHLGERTAVIADVHLGYEWARASAGDCVPAHSLTETLARLEGVLARGTIKRLVVAGDLVETPRPCARTAADVVRLGAWLHERGISLVVLEGNHDRSLPWMMAAFRSRAEEAVPAPTLLQTLDVAGWTIGHGHLPISGERLIIGHYHPVLKAAGQTAPCFLAAPRWIVLPAFSRNAAGYNVATEHLPTAWCQEPLRCFVSTGRELLDFGPLLSLRHRLRSGKGD